MAAVILCLFSVFAIGRRTAPRTADGHPDLSGMWNGGPARGEYWGTGRTSSHPPITYHVSLSYLTPAMRVDIKRTNPDVRQIQLVNNSFAWNESVPGAGFIPGTTATPTPGTVKDRLLELWSTPHGALKAAELVQMQ
ncbi:MAG: hypothetical protein DMG14_31985, partial [Acidobacteria bacterium]